MKKRSSYCRSILPWTIVFCWLVWISATVFCTSNSVRSMEQSLGRIENEVGSRRRERMPLCSKVSDIQGTVDATYRYVSLLGGH